MNGICKVVKVFPAKKNPAGVTMYRYQFEDFEGYKGYAFSDVAVEVGNTCTISMRNYKGNWYPKHVTVVE